MSTQRRRDKANDRRWWVRDLFCKYQGHAVKVVKFDGEYCTRCCRSLA